MNFRDGHGVHTGEIKRDNRTKKKTKEKNQVSVETGMNWMVITKTMKIIKTCNFMRAPRLRASPRHGGAVRCLQICL